MYMKKLERSVWKACSFPTFRKANFFQACGKIADALQELFDRYVEEESRPRDRGEPIYPPR